MSPITWSAEYIVKIPEVDKEHEELSKKINGLYEAMMTGRDCKVVNKIADELISYTEKHFINEEKMMISDIYPDAVSHKVSHDKLFLQLKTLMEDICTENKRDIFKITSLDDWFVDHLLIEDKQYGLYKIMRG